MASFKITSYLLKEKTQLRQSLKFDEIYLYSVRKRVGNGTKIKFAQSLLLLVQGMRIEGVMRV